MRRAQPRTIAAGERRIQAVTLRYPGCGKGLPRLRQALDFW